MMFICLPFTLHYNTLRKSFSYVQIESINGRTIPSFRQLLEIEKLDWSIFKKLLPTKKDKQVLDELFENAKLYTCYLGNRSNPIVLESVIMSVFFHNYKQLLQVSKDEDKSIEDSLKKEIISLINNKPECKILFYTFSKKWHVFYMRFTKKAENH
jgi:hypothetical protein